MKMYKEQIELESHGGRPTYFDITPQLKKIIQESGIKDGICAVSVSYTHLSQREKLCSNEALW